MERVRFQLFFYLNKTTANMSDSSFLCFAIKTIVQIDNNYLKYRNELREAFYSKRALEPFNFGIVYPIPVFVQCVTFRLSRENYAATRLCKTHWQQYNIVLIIFTFTLSKALNESTQSRLFDYRLGIYLSEHRYNRSDAFIRRGINQTDALSGKNNVKKHGVESIRVSVVRRAYCIRICFFFRTNKFQRHTRIEIIRFQFRIFRDVSIIRLLTVEILKRMLNDEFSKLSFRRDTFLTFFFFFLYFRQLAF